MYVSVSCLYTCPKCHAKEATLLVAVDGRMAMACPACDSYWPARLVIMETEDDEERTPDTADSN